MLGRYSDLLSVTWWLRREEIWPELLFGWAQCEINDTFCTTSKDSALWVRNDPVVGLDGTMVDARIGRLV